MLFCELNTKLTVNIGDFVGCLHKLQSFRNSMCPLVMSAGTNRYGGTSIIRFMESELDGPDTYILFDVLMCSIVEHFYELCRILRGPQGYPK